MIDLMITVHAGFLFAIILVLMAVCLAIGVTIGND